MTRVAVNAYHRKLRPNGAGNGPARNLVRSLRAATRTVVFFLKVLPMLPSKPVDWLTPAPKVARVRYPVPGGTGEGDLYRPSTAGPHPGVVVCLGVVPFGVDHPQVPRLGEALARAGFTALLWWSPAMRDIRLDPEDINGIALAYEWLIEQPYIDSDRSGLLGTCVGGSFALMAAAEPAIRDRVGFVAAWAPYASIRSLARDIASGTTCPNGETESWNVDQLTRGVYVRSLTATLESDEAELLRSAFSEHNGSVDSRSFSAEGQAILELLAATDYNTAESAIEQLPIALQKRLDAMSPERCLQEIEAPLIILAHDRDDAVIPIGESRRLQFALSGSPGVRYTEFTMFKHLDPTKVHLSRVALVRELALFVRCVYPMFRQALDP